MSGPCFLLCYHAFFTCYKTTLKSGGLYIESTSWTQSKKAIINHQDKHDECFKNTVLNYK